MWQEWRGRTFPAVIEHGAATWPSRTALRGDEGDVSYEALRDSVAVVAGRLSELGIGAGDRVAYLMGVGREWVETYFAVLGLGATLVPLNLTWTSGELLRGLALTEAHALIVGDRHRGERLLPSIEAIEDDLAGLGHLRTVITAGHGRPTPAWRSPTYEEGAAAGGTAATPTPTTTRRVSIWRSASTAPASATRRPTR